MAQITVQNTFINNHLRVSVINSVVFINKHCILAVVIVTINMGTLVLN